MAISGASPSARDRKEFHRMGAEKFAAFNESWNAMAVQAFRTNQQLALAFMRTLWYPWAGRGVEAEGDAAVLNPCAITTSRGISRASSESSGGSGWAPDSCINTRRLSPTRMTSLPPASRRAYDPLPG
jgi:hypothetical protein